ncbi:MAG: LPS-assembly protein LptD [Bacteroidales bacterium]|nr:LPS-assembly protein LptD [Bacteroidales bacterium]
MLFIFSLLAVCATAQDVHGRRPVRHTQDTSVYSQQPVKSDTVVRDSVVRHPKRISHNAVKSVVFYSAKDSTVNDLNRRYTYLFGDAVVKYEDLELRADYIEIDFKNSELYASGVADSNGNVHGSPLFIQGESRYRAHEIKYNFTTQKGKITHVITTQDEGFIHGEQIKKMGDNVAFLKNGKYTTCELDHPHYEIDFTKAKLIQHDKIVIGPAYLSFTGVPTPLAVPFGFFPLDKGRRSGFVMPSFGQSSNLGFYLQDLGYYFAINDNIDLLLGADVYTRGSWGIKAKSNYVFRYICAGNVHLEFAQTRVGDKLDSTYRCSNNFKIYWDHKQDIKSHPTTRFNAHIDIVSSNYSKYNLTSTQDYLSNQYSSSINVSTSARDIFFLDATLSYSQNTRTQEVNFKLPDMNMSVVQFYPFRKKNKAGMLKWYDNISLKWSSQLTGQIDTYDTLFLKPETWESINVGMRHVIPLTIPIKIAKLINWNTTATLTEKWYLQSYTRDMTIDTLDDVPTITMNQYFHRGFKALHDLNVSTSLSTKIYVMYSFKKGGLQAIRHIITPNLSFTYRPNLSGGTMNKYFNPITGELVEYSMFDNAIFGGVTTQTQALAQLNFGNNLEIKVRSRKDTITGFKKVPLIDNLNVGMYYNFAADSLRWSKLTLNGRSTLFKQLYLTYNFAFDPYIIGENGNRVNRFEVKENRRLFRLSSTDFSVALNWRLDQNTFKSKKKKEDVKRQPWSLTLNYTFTYGINDNIYYYMRIDTVRYKHNMVHTINIVGDFHITKKWRVGFATGYDFVQKSLSYTSIDIHRDMHCWEMSFNWVPFGYRKGWAFQINVKAAVLKDVLKLPLHQDYRDNL